MISITPTKLADFLTCPLKYKLRHLEKSGGLPSSPALSFGNTMHQALQAIHTGQNMPVTVAESTQMLKRFWDKGAYSTREEAAEYFNKGIYSLENYCKAAAESKTETLGTEVFMSLIIDFKGRKIRLGCKADRLALNPDNVLQLIDYKTSRSGKIPTAEYLKTDLPTFLYFILARLTYPQYPKLKITFLNVLTMSETSIEYEKPVIDENRKMLWEQMKRIISGDFNPRISECCAWCDYKDECPATNRVVDYREIQEL